MTFDQCVWHAGSSWPYVGHIRKPRSYVKKHSHRTLKISPFQLWMHV